MNIWKGNETGQNGKALWDKSWFGDCNTLFLGAYFFLMWDLISVEGMLSICC